MLALVSNVYSQSSSDYLEKILAKLQEIQTIEYDYTSSLSAPYDTLLFETMEFRFSEFTNPSDEVLGVNFIAKEINDSTKIRYIYDGNTNAMINWEQEMIMTSQQKKDAEGVPSLMTPFFKQVQYKLAYLLNNDHEFVQEDYGDSLKISFNVYDKMIIFVKSPFVLPFEGEISQFDIWIDKSTMLPYKIKNKFTHQTQIELCSNIKIKEAITEPFIAAWYFPAHFKLMDLNTQKFISPDDLLGKKAPDWTLKDTNGNEITLQSLDSKVLVLQFTGVGCGPCHSSIPFLKQLVAENKNNDFELVSIESWSTNVEGLKQYQNKNEFNFKFLMAPKELTKQYNIASVPVFFVLDKDRTITKVIQGYQGEITDQILRDAISAVR